MEKDKLEEKVNSEGGQMGIIFNVPTNTVKLEVIATVIDDDNKTYKMNNTINLPDLYDARIMGAQWEMENIKYVLTDKTKEELEYM